MKHATLVAAAVMFVAVVGCSSNDKGTSGTPTEGTSGSPTSGTSSGTSGSSSTTTTKFSCKLNGTCYKCETLEDVGKCGSSGPGPGCAQTEPTYCDN